MCTPGEAIELRPEPKNPADPRAIAVYSSRGVQIGYVPADYAQWIGGRLAEIKAVFQRAEPYGAVIRITFDGSDPILPDDPFHRVKGDPAADPDGWGEDDWPPRPPRDEFGGI